MNHNHQILVFESWKLSHTGVVAEIRHFENRLERSKILSSVTTGLEWEIKCKILFSHTLNEQIKCTIEQTMMTWRSFSDI